MVNPLIITTSNDPFTRGLDYLYGVRGLALDPEMIDVVHDLENRIPICTWIGQNIDLVNAQLNVYLQHCHDCFHDWEQPTIQIFAAPLAQSFRLEALCNFQTNPITILIDVGRLQPKDWLLAVVHEYAHAHAGSPGHHQQFVQSLIHLCLGFQIPPPPASAQAENLLRVYPPCVPNPDALIFWKGEVENWQPSITNSYFMVQSLS
ncbi:hypothetical protein ACQ4M4_21435 [Leptolyngbya sp. AN02str]|uniref:hypothetical protein n=1 Tax=Leptolyngbya sp. AN02str TaxID=3423363 RepID=UPI003D314867